MRKWVRINGGLWLIAAAVLLIIVVADVVKPPFDTQGDGHTFLLR